MQRHCSTQGWLAVVALVLGAAPLFAQSSPPRASAPQADEKKFEDFDKVVKGAKQYEGLFKLYQKDDKLYAELRNSQLDKPLLCPITLARGMGMGGHILNFDEQWVLAFKRVGDKVHLIRRNVHFKAKPGSPAATAVETTYTDSVLIALPIRAINHMRQSILINLNDIFMTDFAQLGLGHFDTNRSTWHKVKAFPKNIEVEVQATYAGRRYHGDDSIIDGRGTTVVIHYGLCELPDNGYHPRLADDRVGYFLSAVKDFSSDSNDTAFLRYVERWRLERAEPEDPKRPGRLSAPKKKIVFWIEKSVPTEYRAYVREGILEWNKAFEKVGFRDAIEVRQQENEDFDPEDINYNTFRWITSDQGYAMGPSRANPLTGEILDADIVFDASMVRYWKQEYQIQKGTGGQPASMIEAGRRGWGLTLPKLPVTPDAQAWSEPRKGDREKPRIDPRLYALRHGTCQCSTHLRYELGIAAMAFAARAEDKKGEKVPEELIGQAIKHVTMHEVGHTLGLRHNFKASTMLRNEQLNDTSITRKQGMIGSVMDYAPVNVAPKGVKQGDYFSVVLGPYDFWAIEYAYRPLSGGTEGELEKLREIAKKGAMPGHDYGTDEDLYTTSDPLINLWDLGNDPMKFARDRMQLSEELLKTLAEKVVDRGEGYQKLRQAFGMLLGQYGNGAFLAAGFIGGEHAHRDHRGDPSGRDPFVPVKAEKQREALKFLQQHILTDQPFRFSPVLLRRLAADRWMHWGNDSNFGPVDYPVHQRILAIQKVVLRHVFSPDVLARIQNNALKIDKGEKPLTLAELFRGVTDAVWSESGVKEVKGGKKTLESSVIIRNLQREHLQDLSALVLGRRIGAPPDARSLARFHLRQIDRLIKKLLDDRVLTLDDTARAHLEECQERIARVLNASIQVAQP
jgi:Met-zincin/Domain of unknown function (DUF5117)/Domain of unknown function (DUF5118)